MQRKLRFLNFIQTLLIVTIITSPIIFIIYINNSFKRYNSNIGGSISTGGIIFVNVLMYITILFLICLLQRLITKTFIKKGMTGNSAKIVGFIKKNPIKSFMIIGLYFIVLLFCTIYILQDKLIFYPRHNYNAESYLLNEDTFNKININENDKKYSGWGLIDEDNIKPTILYFGGNAQNSSTFFMDLSLNKGFELYKNYNFIMIDYPGYGLSSGKPSEVDLYIMADVVFKFVSSLDAVDETNITIMGFSLGTGVASYVASKYDVKSLILLSPYSSLLDVANKKINIFIGPLKKIIKNQFDNSVIASEITCDVLIIYSKDDEVIPFNISEKYINFLSDNIKISVNKVVNLSHNDLLTNSLVSSYISNFIN